MHMSQIRKSITISEAQNDYVLSRNLVLSKIVQKTISYMMAHNVSVLSESVLADVSRIDFSRSGL